MALPNTTTITKPAIAEKTFPHLWLSSVIVSAPSLTAGKVNIETLPFNGDTGEIGSGADMIAIKTDELWDAVGEVPEVAAAMGAILAAVGPLRDWVAAREVAAISINNVIQ